MKKFLLGCLVSSLVSFLIFLILIGGAYYFFTNMKKTEPGSYFQVDDEGGIVSECKDSLDCLDEEVKECGKAKGITALGDFADVELEVLGKSGTSCVVFGRIIEVKEIPVEVAYLPDVVLNELFKDLSMECLVPQEIYTGGIESIGVYIGDNTVEVCKGPLFDVADKFNIDLSKY